MSCLETRRRELAGITRRFEQADAPLVTRAVAAAQGLPSPEACDDTPSLLALALPTWQQRVTSMPWAAQLAEIGTLERVGRYARIGSER